MKLTLLTRFSLAFSLCFTLLLNGCGSSYYSNGTSVSMGVVADQISDLESKTVHRSFSLSNGESLRIRNLAGTIDIVPGDPGVGDSVVVDAVVFAKGRDAAATRTLLDDMVWTQSTDRKGRPEWTLDYPVDRHSTLHYSQDGPGFKATTTHLGSHKISITTKKNSSTPTLFANLTITMPPGVDLSVRSLAGGVLGTTLAGELNVDTVVGGIEIESFTGTLTLDTGSGEITAGAVDGKYVFDTGSGDIHAGELTGKGVLDTGSGDIFVDDATGESLRADTGSGDIRIGRTKVRSLDAGTGSGNVSIRNATGQKLRADTGSGSIEVDDGQVDSVVADTGSGNIRIRGLEFIDFRGDTGSGNISIESSLADAESIIADTGSGSITIHAGPDASFRISADQGSGMLRVKYEDAKLRYDGRVLVGATRGEGQTRIVADTGSGNCVIGPG